MKGNMDMKEVIDLRRFVGIVLPTILCTVLLVGCTTPTVANSSDAGSDTSTISGIEEDLINRMMAEQGKDFSYNDSAVDEDATANEIEYTKKENDIWTTSLSHVLSIDISGVVYCLKNDGDTLKSGSAWSEEGTVMVASDMNATLLSSSQNAVEVEISRSVGDQLIMIGEIESDGIRPIIERGYWDGLLSWFGALDEFNGVAVDSSMSDSEFNSSIGDSGITYRAAKDTAHDSRGFFSSPEPTSFTWGQYQDGTRWAEGTVYLDMPYVLLDHGRIDCPVNPTKNGYFVIDLTDVAPGRYIYCYEQSNYDQYLCINIVD